MQLIGQFLFHHHHLQIQLRQHWIGPFARGVPNLIQAIKEEKDLSSDVKSIIQIIHVKINMKQKPASMLCEQ